jgi:UDP-N-acetylmuramoyl-L-alanyl-D-glutamate--2,6-diaminopimelate ligase
MIERLSSDSRRCAPGIGFFAYPGTAADGRDHIPEAIARGAAAVVWEQEGFSWRPEWRLPNAPVAGLKTQAGSLAHAFYARPSDSLWVCGVTGTNGKTSCTQWLAAALSARGERAGVIGTLGSGYPGDLLEANNTTPDALELHRMLSEFRASGAKAVAIEVSSHGLEQGRANGVRFACALFTNLTRDHLDYHGSMAAYAASKERLFDFQGLETAVLNVDDPLGAQLAKRLGARGQRTIAYGISAEAASKAAAEFIAARAIFPDRIQIASSWGDAEAEFRQLGRFNVANALGVVGCLVAYGVPLADAARALESLPDVPGRMQRFGGDGSPLAVVDYAHSPDALDNALRALRPLARARGGRLIAVFGAGGERDPGKRPIMGEIAARLADRVIVTSDNPRGEDPAAIIAAIRAGAARPVDAEPDRTKAIAAAIAEATDRDVVLVAGKGHETTQEMAGRTLPYSDRAAVEAALRRRSPQ